MLAGKSLRGALIAAGLAAALVVVVYPTDEKRVREAADALLTAVSGSDAELARALEAYASPNVSLDVAELPAPLSGREALVVAAREAKQLAQKPHLRVEAVEISVEGNRARLTADLITTLRPEVPELRRPRHSVALFEKRSGRFRLVSAEIGPERLDLPEARP